MIKHLILLLTAYVLFSACAKKELTKEDAFTLLEKSGKYPQVLSYEIYTKDSEDGKKMLTAGLEKEGLVTVERNRKTGDNHAPIIQFTEKATQYLLEPDKGQLSSVQRVKIAEEVLDEIISFDLKDQSTINITYTTKFINVNPFAKLDRRDFGEKKNYKTTIILTKEGWSLL